MVSCSDFFYPTTCKSKRLSIVIYIWNFLTGWWKGLNPHQKLLTEVREYVCHTCWCYLAYWIYTHNCIYVPKRCVSSLPASMNVWDLVPSLFMSRSPLCVYRGGRLSDNQLNFGVQPVSSKVSNKSNCSNFWWYHVIPKVFAFDQIAGK